MKKLIAVLLSVVLMLSAVSALAVDVNWADLQEQGAELIAKGDFVTFDEIAVKMWVPTAFTAVELGDEDKEAGYIAYFMTEDQSAAIGVQYVDVSGMALEDYKAMLPDYGATELEDVTINGLPAVTYVIAETDTVVTAFTTQMGYILEVSVSPKSNEGVASIAAFVMASIQAE